DAAPCNYFHGQDGKASGWQALGAVALHRLCGRSPGRLALLYACQVRRSAAADVRVFGLSAAGFSIVCEILHFSGTCFRFNSASLKGGYNRNTATDNNDANKKIRTSCFPICVYPRKSVAHLVCSDPPRAVL